MKKVLFAFSFLFCISISQAAPPPSNSYPFFDDFESYTGNGGIVTGVNWFGGNGNLKSVQSHGEYSTRGLSSLFGPNIPGDSIQTLAVGPLVATSKVFFKYRIVDVVGYPLNPHTMASDARFWVTATQGATTITIMDITASNQGVPTTDFTYFEFPLTQFVGGGVTVKIHFTSGTTFNGSSVDCYLDIDNFGIGDQVVTSIAQDNTEKWRVFNTAEGIQIIEPGQASYEILNMGGQKVYSQQALVGSTLVHHADLPNGIYLVRRTVSNVPETRKIIVTQ